MLFSTNPAKRRVQAQTATLTALLIAVLSFILMLPFAFIKKDEHLPDFMGHLVTAPITVQPVDDPKADPLTFEIRKDCRIARFGVAPWLPKGKPKDARWEQMTRLWLDSIGMPRAGHDGAIARLRGPSAGEVMIKNTTGVFNTTWRSGNLYVSCLNSATRFGSDAQEEPADSYPYVFNGATYDLMIIKRCGNVTEVPRFVVPVLPAPPAAPAPTPLPPGAFSVPPAPYPLPSPGTPYIGPPVAPHAPLWPGRSNEVPEPGVFALFGVALAALVVVRRRKK